MKSIKNLFIWFVVLSAGVISSSVFAAQGDIEGYDCLIGKSSAISGAKIIQQPEIDIITNLLHNACIDMRLSKETDYQDLQKVENSPQSPLFLDQCVSVGFRKLDANQKLLYPGLVASSTGLQRQQFLAEQTDRIDPGSRDIVPNEFTKIWGLSNSEGYAWDYYKVCNECLYSYKNIPRSQYKFSDDSFRLGCYNLAEDRILREEDFVESFNNQKLNMTISNSVDNYLNTYIGQDRMPSLIDKLNNMLGLFDVVVQKVGPGTQSCNS